MLDSNIYSITYTPQVKIWNIQLQVRGQKKARISDLHLKLPLVNKRDDENKPENNKNHNVKKNNPRYQKTIK